MSPHLDGDDVVSLLFPGPKEPTPPEPLLRHPLTFLVDGKPIRYLGEIWRTEDAPLLPFPTTVDLTNPGHSYSMRIFDLVTRREIHPVSSEEARAALERYERRGRSRG